MFRGPATVMRPNRHVIPFVVGSSAATLLLLPVGMLLTKFSPGDVAGTVMPMVAFGMGTVFVGLLYKVLKPRGKRVILSVDHSGIYADDAPLVLRPDITQAYIRPDIAERRGRVSGSAGIFRVTIPAYPLTVEVLTRSGGQFNIDPGGQENAAAILTALGLPVAMCAPIHTQQPSRTRRWVSVVVVLGLLFVVIPIVVRIFSALLER